MTEATEMRCICCEVCDAVLGECTLPIGLSDAEWRYRLAGRTCDTCATAKERQPEDAAVG